MRVTRNDDSLARVLCIHADFPPPPPSPSPAPQIVKALLEHGADVHAQQESPLLAAAEHGHHGIVELLLDRECTAAATA